MLLLSCPPNNAADRYGARLQDPDCLRSYRSEGCILYLCFTDPVGQKAVFVPNLTDVIDQKAVFVTDLIDQKAVFMPICLIQLVRRLYLCLI